MKRQKKLFLMGLALALLLGCYGLVTVLTTPKNTAAAPDEPISLGVADGLSAMGWQYEDVSVQLMLQEGKWLAKSDADCPVDQALVKKLAAKATDLAANRVLTQPEDRDVYGFDSKEAVSLHFTKGDETVTLTVGNTDPYGKNTYVLRNNDASRVYLVPTDSLTAFVLPPESLVEKEALPAFTDVLSLHISGKHDLELSFAKGGSAQCYTDLYEWFLQTDSKLLPLNTEAVETLLKNLSTLRWGDCVTYKADAAALAKYGLEAPALTLSVLCDADTTGQSAAIHFGKYDEASKTYYARLAGSKMVYQVSSSLYDALSKLSYDDLRARDVLKMDWFQVRDVAIALNGKTRKLELIEGTGSTAALTYSLDGVTADAKLGSAFLNSISTMQAQATGKKPEKEAVLTLSLQMRADGKALTVTFSPSGDGYVVQLDGTGDLWISAAQYKTITDAYAALTAK